MGKKQSTREMEHPLQLSHNPAIFFPTIFYNHRLSLILHQIRLQSLILTPYFLHKSQSKWLMSLLSQNLYFTKTSKPWSNFRCLARKRIRSIIELNKSVIILDVIWLLATVHTTHCLSAVKGTNATWECNPCGLHFSGVKHYWWW